MTTVRAHAGRASVEFSREEIWMNILTRLDNRSPSVHSPSKQPHSLIRPSRAEAEQAVTTLIRWAGDDPDREGLLETPARVVRAYEEWFAGYGEDPDELLRRTFEEVAGYDEMVLLRDIRFVSHCEHHMAPIVGRAHIGYLPRKRVVGISNWHGSSRSMRGACRFRSALQRRSPTPWIGRFSRSALRWSSKGPMDA